MGSEYHVPDEAAMRKLGIELGARWQPGDLILLEGPLGAGKTTLVRGYIESLGHADLVRSPTFNLIQTFDTTPPVMHADLYRLATWQGIGLEDYLDSHVCLIEWPDRAAGLAPLSTAWIVLIEFRGTGRRVTVTPPKSYDNRMTIHEQ
jgi:tRNA threonylcarbamoyladenosine biosynthesis protein TsaE